MKSSKIRYSALLLIVVVGAFIYSNTLDVPLHFDDDTSLVKNRHIRLTEMSLEGIEGVISGIKGFSKRPVAHISFALNYYFHEYHVAGYHIVNIMIHIFTGILLYLLTETTLRITDRQTIDSQHHRFSDSPHPQILNPSILALFSVLLWFVHPIQTQSVTYIVQRMNSMAAMFYILSMLFYIKGRLASGKRNALLWFAGCLLAGLLAIGSKEIAATLPIFILIYEWFFFQGLEKAWLKRKLPYIVGILILLGFAAFVYLGKNPFQAILSSYRYMNFTLTERVLTEFRVLMHYIGLLFYPHPARLNFDYDFPLSNGLLSPVTTLLSIGGIFGLLALAVFFAKKNRLISFSILWFLGNLVIESSIIGLEIIYEHRVYLPSMLFFLPFVIVIGRHVKQSRAAVTVGCCVIFLLSLWTYQRNAIWKDPVTFWRDCVKKSGGKARPHNNLGLALYKQGYIDEAVGTYGKALRINPAYPRAHNNLGAAMTAKGNFEKAVKHYSLALRSRPNDPEVHNNMGGVLYEQGKLDQAVGHYLEALRVDPISVEALNGLGLTLARQGRFAEAVARFSRALQIMPGHAEAHNNLGAALHRLGRIDEAISHYTEALRIDPNHQGARRNLRITKGQR